ncbi:MAG TPA: hypothetical protein VEI24_01820 [Nitrospiria bacterium]|nr:hypothetical protein [Nitrospiria bacterium]
MKWVKTRQWLVMAVVMVSGLLTAACTSYFKVTDPTSGSVYYTEKVSRSSGGAVTFTDAKSGSEVTIQNSEVKEISEKEFDVGRYSSAPASKSAPAAPAPAAPAQPSAPAPTPESAPAPEGGGGY